MKIRDGINECGTPITVFKCDSCGEEFSVCPAVSDNRLEDWAGCQMEWCGSYDESRDADKMLEEGTIKFVSKH